MTLPAKTPRYFVVVLDGKPLPNRYAPEMPMVFQDEQSALAAVENLDPSACPSQIAVEGYSENFDFLGQKLIERPLSLS